jgi:choline monooxygenase
MRSGNFQTRNARQYEGRKMDGSALALRKGESELRTDPAESFTLPARFYFDPAIYELEKNAIFYKSWWYAGHKSQLAEPGAYISTRIHEQSVFVIRGREGELKAFYNVCQHRGHELLAGSGKTRMIVCPYHAWSYDFDGKLRGARNTERMASFDKCDFSLKPVRVEEFCGLVFVNLDPDAVAFKEQSGELESEIRKYCPKVDSLVYADRQNYEVKSNWKVLVDNFSECYHCAPAHRDFVDLVDMKSYRTRARGIYASQISNAARSTENSAYKFQKGEVDFGYAGWYVWPNLTIWCYPGETNLLTLQMIPDGPERTIEYADWFLATPEPSPQIRDAMAYMDQTLQPEDIKLCESVQRGLRSNGFNQGRFVIDPELSELSEHAVHHFQRMVAEALGLDLLR